MDSKGINTTVHSKNEISRTHIVVFADESFTFKNHFQIDTIKCYTDEKGLQFHLLAFNRTPKCNHSDIFHLRHCLLAEILESWSENDFVYAIDSDVIYHGYETKWNIPKENIDLVFFERWWNGEVMAGEQLYISISLPAFACTASHF